MTPFHYALYGLTLRSDIGLPELAPVDAVAEPDVWVRLADVDAPATEGQLDTGPTYLRFEIARVGRFEARGGHELLAQPAPDADLAQVRLYLLGSAMAAVLTQRGRFALHASALVFDGAAVAFMGPSGAGKSTLAAWMIGQGARLLSDDVCAIETDESGQLLALPGIARLRLFEDSAVANGLVDEATGEVRFDEEWRKFIVPATPAPGPVPLRAVYLIQPGTDGIVPLAGADAVATLSANSYRGEYLALVGNPQRHFDDLVAIASRVKLFRFGRPMALAEMDAINLQLLEHVRVQTGG